MTEKTDIIDSKTFVEVTIVGKDKEGIVADTTNYIFKNGGNIEKINQNVVKGLFGMHLEASFHTIDKAKMQKELGELGKKLQMEVKVHFHEENKVKNVAILVSREDHCLLKILNSKTAGEINCNISLIIGSDEKLKPIADNYSIPFFFVNHTDQNIAEKEILNLVEKFDIDLIVLARYMRILTPNFVWRYPNRIINIHPSLLPAFPGAYAYVQAYERGAKIIGCTAHFVTEDLDQGPIIIQESFKVAPEDTLETIKIKGQIAEAFALLEAVKLFLEDKLEVYWGKVTYK
ncbi:formyltetrahydrofolate deformylase [Candidatus Nitrosocosmicus agrestis]|jgi:formyltetrahydrofolate deformylase|uniref:formyltetrahydrofolate deformylase n=1 Tax=Candidatus Nitrosocosmicus agrestis TaxID=2563600 RepID=UPI00122DFE73|nr:formyltetrahydrofolate deformylase [Candidatus Nitrosocosmicus sp. SS]KAA2283603.1 formyltetrahydrofolate deformylase [Candidatus Nitrosocosmicus sp. SS]KAF0869685.1 formyltetrahydrofolate deformylase [Candidatus Nitrosocosmicus sp. SS]MDR4490185.1 formyltetrahydrofolate deformylase [Candidatus Nitrosocosmicus sp.]